MTDEASEQRGSEGVANNFCRTKAETWVSLDYPEACIAFARVVISCAMSAGDLDPSTMRSQPGRTV